MAGHQMHPPPQATDHRPESEPATPASHSDQACAEAGPEVALMEQMGGDTAGGDTPTKDAEHMKEETDSHLSASGSGDNQSEAEEQKEEEGEEEGVEEEEEEEEDGLDDPQSENNTQNFPPSSDRSSGRSSSRDPPVSKYNTVCYRKIKRGNTKQRIDEFEFMMSV